MSPVGPRSGAHSKGGVGTLARRNARHVLVALLLAAMVGGTLTATVLPDYLARLSADRSLLGYFQTIGLLAAFALSPLAGWLADRWGNSPLLPAVAGLANGGLWLIYPLLPSFETALVVRALEGGSSAFLIGPALGLIAQEDARAVALGRPGARPGGLVSVAAMLLLLGVGIGISFGGVLGKRELTLPFLVSGVLLGAVACGFALLAPYAGDTQGPAPFARPDAAMTERAPLAPARGEARPALVWVVLGFALADRLAAGFVMSSLLLHMRLSLGWGPDLSGVGLGLLTLPMALRAPFVVRMAGRQRLLEYVAVSSIVYGLALPVLTIARGQLFWVVLTLAGLAAAFMYAPTLVAAHLWTPPEHRSRTMALVYGIGSLGYAIGPALSFWIEGQASAVMGVALAMPVTVAAMFFGMAEVLLAALLLALGRFSPPGVPASRTPSATGDSPARGPEPTGQYPATERLLRPE